jgi:hypothetical protein
MNRIGIVWKRTEYILELKRAVWKRYNDTVIYKTHRLVNKGVGDLAIGNKSTVKILPSVFDKSIDY